MVKTTKLRGCTTAKAASNRAVPAAQSLAKYGKPVSARARARKLQAKRKRHVPQHHTAKQGNYYGSECADDSGNQATMTDARYQHAYYALIVKNHFGDWRYVVPYEHGLTVSSTPAMFAGSTITKLTALWERVVLHNAIPWNDSVMPQTLRIIAYSLDIQEVTETVFGDDYEHKRKTAALLMLEDQDARRLGLADEKAKQVLFHNPEYEDEDEHLLRQLNKESTSHSLENLLVLD